MAAHDWEVIVADDGSGPETRDVVNRWRDRFPCGLHHVWHEDRGFRLAAIRNRSAVQSRGDWLVFIDGDCIPFPDFAWQHAQLTEPGWFVAGNRVLLSEHFTEQLLQAVDPIAPVRWNALQWLIAHVRGQTNRTWPWLRLSLGPLRKLRPKSWAVLKGCNIGVSRQDYLAVNGFDEAYSGWGREDSDFAIRMVRHGSRLKDGRYSVPLLHLWHRENARNQLAENDQRLAELLNGQRIRATSGVDQYPLQDTVLDTQRPPQRS
jgi:glycosyltransferase involved in cell wall biosynthesis